MPEPTRPQLRPRRPIAASRSAIDTAFEIVTWLGTAVTLTAVLIVASTLSATVDARPTPADVITTGR